MTLASYWESKIYYIR